MTRKSKYHNQALRDFLDANFEGITLVDGHDNAILGIGESCGGVPRLVYSRYKVIENLQDTGIEDYDDAQEFFESNIAGAYVGESTPIFLASLKDMF